MDSGRRPGRAAAGQPGAAAALAGRDAGRGLGDASPADGPRARTLHAGPGTRALRRVKEMIDEGLAQVSHADPRYKDLVYVADVKGDKSYIMILEKYAVENNQLTGRSSYYRVAGYKEFPDALAAETIDKLLTER